MSTAIEPSGNADETVDVPKNRERDRQSRNWWGALRRGLVVDETGKHYQAMGKALWLFCYLVLNADWRRGTLYRKLQTINRDTGIKERTIRQWLILLRRHGYIETRSNGRGLEIRINKWRSIVRSSANPKAGR